MAPSLSQSDAGGDGTGLKTPYGGTVARLARTEGTRGSSPTNRWVSAAGRTHGLTGEEDEERGEQREDEEEDTVHADTHTETRTEPHDHGASYWSGTGRVWATSTSEST